MEVWTGGKLQYVWAYYKPAMAAVVGIILAIVFIWQTVENAKYKTVLNVSVIGASVGEQAEEIQEELQEQFGTENKYDKVTFDTSFMMQDVETADYNIMMKLYDCCGSKRAGCVDYQPGLL